jgi:signal transduction histidine kinase
MAEALSADEVLPRMAQAAAHGIGAQRVRVRVYVPGSLDRAVAWPPGAVDAKFDRTVPVMNYGELLGEVSISKPSGVPVTPAEDRLLKDFAAQAAPAFIRVQLDAQLQAQLAEISAQAMELRASRQRIVAAQDIERRRLERDIHDGAQQHLVALAINARLALELVKPDPNEAERLLVEIGSQAGDALATLRDLARGIFPAALADRGLAAALQAQLAIHPTARLVANGAGAGTRFEPEVEAAVYFCCLEALQNCAKHAPGAAIAVSLSTQYSDWLEFAVTDDGPGFDPGTVVAGSGRQNMADRLAAIGGSLVVRSAPGKGTIVSGRLPAQALNQTRVAAPT